MKIKNKIMIWLRKKQEFTYKDSKEETLDPLNNFLHSIDKQIKKNETAYKEFEDNNPAKYNPGNQIKNIIILDKKIVYITLPHRPYEEINHHWSYRCFLIHSGNIINIDESDLDIIANSKPI